MRINLKTKISVLIFIGGFLTAYSQPYAKKYRVQGTIMDGRTKKGIKRIPFTIMPFHKVIDANRLGEFLFNFPKGDYSFVIDYYPFDKKEVKINLKSDTTLVIELHSPFAQQYIQEVEVIATKTAIENPVSMEQIDSKVLRTLPALIGERDILKAFALTAGVTSSSEGAADMQVRGGVHGQNLYLLDGIPLYSTEHFFGLVSVYNPIIVKSAVLYKSDFPVEYGGKLSSVVNVLTEDANLHKFSGAAEISLLSSKVLLNIPLVKEKLALMVSGRLSNYSLINIASLFGSDSNSKVSLHFADLNANMLWKISERDKLKLTWFNNSDGTDNSQLDSHIITSSWLDNRQQNIGANWYRILSERSQNHMMVFADSYVFDLGISNAAEDRSFKNVDKLLTGINTVGIVEKYNLTISDKLKVATGGSLKMLGFSPIQLNHTDTSTTHIQNSNLVRQTEGVMFAETGFTFASHQTLTTGLRVSAVGNKDNLFLNAEPRIGYHGIFKHDFSVSASVCRMTQPVHRLANPGLGIPFELFLPSNGGILPESSWNFSLGAARDFVFSKYSFSVKADAWFKSMQNLVEFQDGYDALSVMMYKPDITQQLKEIITQGSGSAYGLDISGDYSQRYWSLAIDYTLMRAVNKFADLNFGRPYAASTDIRHSLSLTLERKLSSTLTMAATWQYRSGKPITVPTQLFQYPAFNPETGELSNSDKQFMAIETKRNNYRTKPFHKLDITLTQNYKAFKRYDASYSIGLYNVYSRSNPYIYYLSKKQEPNGTYKPALMSMSIFPIMPSFSWLVKF